MLKISMIDTRTKRRLVLEGCLLSPWIDELKKAWRDALSTTSGRKLVLDFAGVTQIDDEAIDAISDLIDQGAHCASGGVLTRHIIGQLVRQRKRQEHFVQQSARRIP